MIYIITTETFPNGLAATQRIHCYAKSVTELGYKCEVLCLNRCEDPKSPLGNIEPRGTIDGYTYRYMGNSTKIDENHLIHTINQVSDTLRLFLFILLYFHKGDKVIYYSYDRKLYRSLIFLMRIKGYETYFELNEHPSHQINGFRKNVETVSYKRRLKDFLNLSTGILCISNALIELLQECGLEKNKLHLVNMLVNSQRFEGLKKSSSDRYIGYCGNASNDKDGVNQLIKAFALISKKYPDLKLYIMGPKQPKCRNEELSKQLGVSEKVVFTGMVTPDLLPQKLLNATILALARPATIQSKYGFPTKLGEYLTTGNPVVVTSVGDIPLFLKDGESAFVAEPDNIDSFAEKLDEALQDTERAILVGKKGRMIAEHSFSHNKVKEQIKVALNL